MIHCDRLEREREREIHLHTLLFCQVGGFFACDFRGHDHQGSKALHVAIPVQQARRLKVSSWLFRPSLYFQNCRIQAGSYRMKATEWRDLMYMYNTFTIQYRAYEPMTISIHLVT